MKKKSIIIILTLVLSILMVAGFSYYLVVLKDVNTTRTYADEYSKRLGNFSAKTASEILSGKEENTCYSPVSLWSVLGIYVELSDGETQAELLAALGYKDKEELESEYKQTMNILNEEFNDKAKVISKNYIGLAGSDYKENEMELINFCTEKMNAEYINDGNFINLINDNVYKITNKNIEKIVPESVEYAIVNALYLKATWYDEMDSIGNKNFKLANGKKQEKEFYEDHSDMNVIIGTKYKAVVKKAMSGQMIFVKPSALSDLDDITDEKTINTILASVSKNENMYDVTLQMPLFKIKTEAEADELQEIIEKAGIKKLFEKPDMAIEYIRNKEVSFQQKTVIDVSDKGIEGLAATSGFSTYGVKSESEYEKLTVTLDEPFMYIYVMNGVPVFIGTVYNPVTE